MVFGFRRKMSQNLRSVIRDAAKELPDISDSSFGSYFDQFGSSRVVLIGDGSHGTSEFYRARATITKRLITEHGFNTLCLECDWPDARTIDHYTRLHPRRGASIEPDVHSLRIFNHFPRWMWRNTETQDFVDWLREHNARLPMNKRTSFNGLDVYSMGRSTRAVVEYLDRVDPALAELARRRYGCLEPWLDDPAEYGRAASHSSSLTCESGVINMLQDLLSKRLELASHPENGESFLDAEMNARVVQDSEAYYRALFNADRSSWDLRDTHMHVILTRLLKLRPGSKAIVWAHNSHIGDARGTFQTPREINLGQLCRESLGPSKISILGCGTHSGTVAASDNWDTEMRIKRINPSLDTSYEGLFHSLGIRSFILDIRGNPSLLAVDKEARLQRFIGVIYRPDSERSSHYVRCLLTRQYDAFLWFDQTEAVHPFEIAQPKEPLAKGETYPFGL
ncbi:hypothetical protein F4679DRAFT_542702 [Xylaria curta]|nr:hypothetical protein F4679DRAFT_542702 [Xylaria curta]